MESVDFFNQYTWDYSTTKVVRLYKGEEVLSHMFLARSVHNKQGKVLNPLVVARVNLNEKWADVYRYKNIERYLYQVETIKSLFSIDASRPFDSVRDAKGKPIIDRIKFVGHLVIYDKKGNDLLIITNVLDK